MNPRRRILITRGEYKNAIGTVSERDYTQEKENLEVTLVENNLIITVPFLDTKPAFINSDMTKNLVLIRRGFYKGYVGYTTVTETTLQRKFINVFLCSNGKIITIDSSDVVPAPKKFQDSISLVTTQVPKDFNQTSDTIYINAVQEPAGYLDFLQDYNPFNYFNALPVEDDDFQPDFETVADAFNKTVDKENVYLEDSDKDQLAGYNERYVYVNERYNPEYIKKHYNKEDQQRVIVIKDTLEKIFGQFDILFVDDSLDAIFSHVDQVLKVINGTETKRGLKTLVNLTESDLEKFSIAYAYYYMNNTGLTSRFDYRVSRYLTDNNHQLTNTNYFFGTLRNLESFQKMDLGQVKDAMDTHVKIFGKVAEKKIIPDSQTVFSDTNLRIMSVKKRRRSSSGNGETSYPKKYKYNTIHNYSKFRRISGDITSKIKSTPIDYPALQKYSAISERELVEKYEQSLKNELTKMSKTASTSERFKRLVLFIKQAQRKNVFLELATNYTLYDGKSAVEVFPTIGRIVKEYNQAKHKRTMELISAETAQIEYRHEQNSYNQYLSKIIETGLITEIEHVIASQNLKLKDPTECKRLQWAIKHMSRIVNGRLLAVERERYAGIISKIKLKYAKNINDASRSGTQEIYMNFSRKHQQIGLTELQKSLQEIKNKLAIGLPVEQVKRVPNKALNDFALKVSDLEDSSNKTFTHEQVKMLYQSYRRTPQKFLDAKTPQGLLLG